MSQIDDILEQCLRDIAAGASSLEECLARHPEHAAQLEPLLRTALRVETGGQVRPSPAFKARARAKLTLHMQAHPRRKMYFGFNVRQLAAGFIALLLAFLATGTVYAQGALPGDALYSWKLASENAWRLVSPNSVNTDFAIANRRIEEINATANDPKRRAQALEGYRAVKIRLQLELDDETLDRILPPIDVTDDYPILPSFTPTTTPTPNSNGNGNSDGIGNGNGNNGNGNGNGKDPKPTHPPTGPTRKPKLIPTIEVPPPVN